jgi:hypothetical protein
LNEVPVMLAWIKGSPEAEMDFSVTTFQTLILRGHAEVHLSILIPLNPSQHHRNFIQLPLYELIPFFIVVSLKHYI